jgi:hypothetical protein
MFQSYDHLQVEINTLEINMTRLFILFFYSFVRIRCYISLETASHVNFQCIYFHLKMVVRPKHVVDNLNEIVKTIEIELR